MVCEERLKQVVFDLVKEFSYFAQYVREFVIAVQGEQGKPCPPAQFDMCGDNSLHDAGLNTILVSNNTQGTNHKEIQQTQKEHRHLWSRNVN